MVNSGVETGKTKVGGRSNIIFRTAFVLRALPNLFVCYCSKTLILDTFCLILFRV